MQNRLLLGVSVGESFAEYSLLSDSKPLAQKRVYLSRESLKQSLSQFVSEQGDVKPIKAFIGLRLPKKLLDYRFSGAVAHLTTEGFEHWLSVCGKNSLTSKDMLFSVPERLSADGKVQKALKTEDLEAIASKLQLMDCKKICLHLLHAVTYPVHEEKARAFFQEKGFEVFTPEKSDTPDEIRRWNRNALNATTSSLFSERKAEILAALENVLTAQDIHFLNASGKVAAAQDAQMEGLFSASTAMGLAFTGKDKADILYLGLENFYLISGRSWSSAWESPWGSVELHHLSHKELGIQPTLGIALNNFGRFDFTSAQEGWEPGPMFLGRGQKPSLLDLWAENAKLTKLQGLEDRFSTPGIQRFKNSLFALSKITRSRENDLNFITKEMQSLSMQRLAMEAFLHRQSTKMIVTGPLASVFANAFKKDSHTVIDGNEFSESQALALCGNISLQESL